VPGRSQPRLVNRVLAFLGSAAFLAFALWAGLCAPKQERIPLDELVIRWRTSAPADSLLTFGRDDPFEHILVKDDRLTTEHVFSVPARPFMEFCRFHVRSTDARSNVASCVHGPGLGPGGTVMQEVSPAYASLCPILGADGETRWADYDSDGDNDVVLEARGEGRGGPRLLRRSETQFDDVTARLCPELRGASVQWGDFNNDGYPDLLACGEGLVVYRNVGPPRWALEPVRGPIGPPGQQTPGVACFADLNGDGLSDIVIGSGARLRTLVNTGVPAHRFREGPPASPPAPAEGAIQGLLCADFDGDGLSDVLARSSRWSLFRNVGGRLERTDDALPDVVGAQRAAAVADYDGDGDIDIYVAPWRETRGVLLANGGAGSFQAVNETGELGALRASASCCAWADITGDGHPDLILGLAAGGLRAFLGDGTGRFIDGTGLCGLPRLTEAAVRSIAVTDLNADSAPDLLVQFVGRGAAVFENRSTQAARGGFITVRPAGGRGLAGAKVTLLNGEQSVVLASGQLTTACGAGTSGPPEMLFGVGSLEEAVIEVRFSDGAVETVRWARGEPRQMLVVGRRG